MGIIIFQTIISTILNLKRTCPKCRRSQIVSTQKAKEVVTCKYCGAKIPPKR